MLMAKLKAKLMERQKTLRTVMLKTKRKAKLKAMLSLRQC